MAVWHWMLGIGLSAIVAIVMQYRALPTTTHHQPRGQNKTFVENDDVCAICMATMQNEEMLYLPCLHAFHDNCVKRLSKYDRLCPKCRAKF